MACGRSVDSCGENRGWREQENTQTQGGTGRGGAGKVLCPHFMDPASLVIGLVTSQSHDRRCYHHHHYSLYILVMHNSENNRLSGDVTPQFTNFSSPANLSFDAKPRAIRLVLQTRAKLGRVYATAYLSRRVQQQPRSVRRDDDCYLNSFP
ncbi:hypothetical protein E2C01_087112 [Portunus trituberculatus]|uniref:Uncharacterized protein n=1 Tax=Portunus trituberculatus TaxID=210409 RepID=A0A5B7J2I3_PORTR|nr:hypothetical protein [Portunus trituberculatus]